RAAELLLRDPEQLQGLGKEAELQQDHAAGEGQGIVRGADRIAVCPAAPDGIAKVVALGVRVAQLGRNDGKEAQKRRRIPTREPEDGERLGQGDFVQMRVEPVQQCEEVVRAEGIGGLAAGFASCRKVLLQPVLQEGAEVQIGKAFLREKRFSARAPEISGYRVKVYDRGEALARGMEFQLRRALA